MKIKILAILLILASLMGYLEWGGNNSMFLIQGEIEILVKLFEDPTSVLHPFILLPLFGQLILVVTIFQKNPSRLLIYTGIACIGLLLVLMFAIGMMELNLKVLFSTFPFLITAIVMIRHLRKKRI